jgi:hypothetical protein
LGTRAAGTDGAVAWADVPAGDAVVPASGRTVTAMGRGLTVVYRPVSGSKYEKGSKVSARMSGDSSTTIDSKVLVPERPRGSSALNPFVPG